MSHQGRVHSIGVNVKGAVYGSIAITCFFSLLGAVGQPHLKEWQPFALSLYLVITWVLCIMGVSSPPRKPEADALGSSEVMS